MSAQNTENKECDISEEELEKLDANLLAIETLYESRCVQAPRASNVTVRDIEDK
ncbi:hypothetical protein [Desulfosediminicola flagellatus]|uniref:hypothetical protein n=1 Tax=Desulfosediminicola flagellatus TaxID=2569541 RepID=UPI0012946CD7|nr:hypothetical protein [Desulfosediminicola flagellatus]